MRPLFLITAMLIINTACCQLILASNKIDEGAHKSSNPIILLFEEAACNEADVQAQEVAYLKTTNMRLTKEIAELKKILASFQVNMFLHQLDLYLSLFMPATNTNQTHIVSRDDIAYHY